MPSPRSSSKSSSLRSNCSNCCKFSAGAADLAAAQATAAEAAAKRPQLKRKQRTAAKRGGAEEHVTEIKTTRPTRPSRNKRPRRLSRRSRARRRSISRDQHHPGASCRRICAAFAGTGRRCLDPLQQPHHARSVAERSVGILRLRPPVRPTVYVAGRVKNAELSAYVSTDFLSAGDTPPPRRPTATRFVFARLGPTKLTMAGNSSAARCGAW